MNKLLRSGLLMLPAIFVMTILSVCLLSGCHERPEGGEGAINEDSVKPHVIPIKEAAELTASFRSTVDTLAAKYPPLKDSLIFGKAESFNRDVFRELLKQKDTAGNLCAGIRIYYGRGKNGLVKLIMVPVDSAGNDIITHLVGDKQVPGVSGAKARDLSGGGDAMEEGQHCPTICSPTSPLNGN